jgi:O-antigen/teichoic acid export membrane protein
MIPSVPANAGIPVPAEVDNIGRTARIAVVQLLFRTGALRAITFVGTIVLARVLFPADYGVFAVIAFLTAILTPIGDLGLGVALIQKGERPTEADLATVFTSQQVLWIAILVLVWVLAPLIRLAGPDMPADAEWMLRVAALAVAIGHLQSVPGAMMSRVLRFGPLAGIEVVQQVLYVAVTLTLALNGAGAWSFVIGLLIQFSVGSALMFGAWGRLPRIGFDRDAFRRLVRFGAFFEAASIANLLREALVPAFGGLAGGVAAIGQLQFGQRLGRLVSSVDEVVGRVAFPAFSRLQEDRLLLERAFVRSLEITGLLIGPVLCWAIAVAPTLVPVLFSDRWTPAVPVFQLTAAAALLGVPAQIMRGVALAAANARGLLVASVVAGVVTLIAFPFLVLSFGLVGGGIGFVLYSALQFAGYALAVRPTADVAWARLAGPYVLAAAAALPSVVVVALLSGPPGLIASGAVYFVSYAILVMSLQRSQARRAWRWISSGGDVGDRLAQTPESP